MYIYLLDYDFYGLCLLYLLAIFSLFEWKNNTCITYISIVLIQRALY